MATSRFSTFLESFDADPKRRGTQWEHVCQWFLETDPVYRAQLKKVWLWDKWPGRWGPAGSASQIILVQNCYQSVAK